MDLEPDLMDLGVGFGGLWVGLGGFGAGFGGGFGSNFVRKGLLRKGGAAYELLVCLSSTYAALVRDTWFRFLAKC